MRVFCVLRSGGDFDREDFLCLQAQVRRHVGEELFCLSDVDVGGAHVPLRHDWSGWWSKIELFRPDLHGDIFYLDLDTVLVGDCRHIAHAGVTTMLSDFYNNDLPASGIMYLKEEDRAAVWESWIAKPHQMMSNFRGDQDFLGKLDFGKKARRFQHDFQNEVISFKAHMRPKLPRAGPHLAIPPTNAKVVCFHGKPRPKNVKEPWIMKARTLQH